MRLLTKKAQVGGLCLALTCLLVLASCGDTGGMANATPGATPIPSGNEGEVVVFAASSLQDAFKQMADGVRDKVTYSFGGSQALVTQLTQGAKADVFASADARNMQAAIQAGLVVSGTEQALVTNRLVVVTAKNTANVATLADLAKPGLKLVLADKTVPAGNYSLQALDNLAADATYGSDFKEKVLANVVSYENNVRQVLSKVQLGEADAGIVYTTDARTAKEEVGTLDIPDAYNVLAVYYIAPIKDAAHPQAAQGFVRYALSADGQRILGEYGFGPPGASR